MPFTPTHSCDALIIGGGPAGSTCARALVRAGLDVLVLDKAVFPRDKPCAGWITPPVIEALALPVDEYREGRVFQPITAFRTSRIGGRDVLTNFDRVVSYGIRRCELDHFLLQRSGARVRAGESLTSLRRDGDRWIANDTIAAPLVIGAGGYFCPVARQLGATLGDEPIVAAQEIEVTLTPAQAEACRVAPDTPELFLCSDLEGYGWCFRKGPVLNVGLGRQDRRLLTSHVRDFVALLMASGRIPRDLAWRWKGHAYLLRDTSPRNVMDDGVLLIGDAAGLAYARSGEGIRPAVESGLLAAQTVLEARGRYQRDDLRPYAARLDARFGRRATGAAAAAAAAEPASSAGRVSRRVLRVLRVRRVPSLPRVPPGLAAALGGPLLANAAFTRHVFLSRWFLRAHEPALVIPAPSPAA